MSAAIETFAPQSRQFLQTQFYHSQPFGKLTDFKTLYPAESMDFRYLHRSEFQVKFNYDVSQYVVDHFE